MTVLVNEKSEKMKIFCQKHFFETGITRKTKKAGKKIANVILTSTLITAVCISFAGLLPIRAEATAYACTENKEVCVDSGSRFTARVLDCEYGNNSYFSVRDIAMAFSDSDAPFDVAVGNDIKITTGTTYGPVGGENVPWSEEELDETSSDAPSMHNIILDGDTVKYSAFTRKNSEGYTDAYMSAVDIAMMLDVRLTIDEDGCLMFDTSSGFAVDPAALENEGFFYNVNGIIVGDATTGEIYFGSDQEKAFPIASTSKLMTYAVVMDAVAAGKISTDDIVTVDREVEELAATPDGIVKFKEGDEISVEELLKCMLLASSNESALALALHTAGSEEAFTELMNSKATELGISDAVFYNCNGLPVYTQSPAPAKCQNRMSAEDMFILTEYIFSVYPQITDITGLKKTRVEYLDYEIENTNALLYNIPEVTGLKTGTTTKSGACLVTSLKMQGSDSEHELVVVVLGAESNTDRIRISEILARYAKNEFMLRNGLEGGISEENYSLSEEQDAVCVPDSPEKLIELLIDRMRKSE